MTTRGAQKKAAAQSKLHERHQMTLTIDMTENNFQRLAALLLFADKIEQPEPVNLGRLPWEDPPETPPAVELELDYAVVRRGIIGRLEPYVKLHGREQVIELLKAHGGDTLPKIPQNRLMDLYNALA